MKNMILRTRRLLSALLISLLATTVHAIPITYLDLDFEDGSLGGPLPSGSLSPVPINNDSGGLLDGRGLFFENLDPFGTQIRWTRGGLPDSDFHYVAFDFFAERGANVTQFLDVPTILRSDIQQLGRHRVEFYYDLSAEIIVSLLDGVIDPTLVTFPVWPASGTSTMRIANQLAPPGDSLNSFWVDNVIWQGDVRFESIPEPTALSLLAFSLAGLGWCRRKRA